MKKLHIMIDCDDVLNNVSEDWVAWLNARHGLCVDARDVSYKNIYQAFPMLTREEVKFPLMHESFSGKWTVKPGSVEALRQMVDDGHEISIVTAHNNKTCWTKFVWLSEQFPFIHSDDVIITTKKQRIIGDVLVDDHVHNLEGGDYLKILFDHPNNHGYDAQAKGVFRVYTLAQAYDVIKKELLP